MTIIVGGQIVADEYRNLFNVSPAMRRMMNYDDSDYLHALDVGDTSEDGLALIETCTVCRRAIKGASVLVTYEFFKNRRQSTIPEPYTEQGCLYCVHCYKAVRYVLDKWLGEQDGELKEKINELFRNNGYWEAHRELEKLL